MSVGIQTEGVDRPVQIDASVDGNAILVGAAVGERVDRRNGDPVGIQIAELRSLLKGHAAAIPAAPAVMWLCATSQDRLSGKSVVMLLGESVGDDAGALLDRFVLFQALRDAAPEGKRLGGGVAGGGKACIARGVQRGDVGGAEIIERFVERFRVDVAVGRVRADVAEIGVAGKRQIAGQRCAAG